MSQKLIDEEFGYQIEINAIEEDIAHRSSEKRALEIEMSSLTSRVRSSGYRGLPDSEYRGICKRQGVIKSRILEIEADLRPLKSKLKELRALLEAVRSQRLASGEGGMTCARPELESAVVKLRNKWLAFAEDQTRVNSMRVMAAQFARELTDALQDTQ